MPFDTPLIPTGGSNPARAAANRGFDPAAPLDATVHDPSAADGSVATSATDVGRDRDPDVVTAVREGRPAEEIVQYADEVVPASTMQPTSTTTGSSNDSSGDDARD